jgi:hypothetical protein
MAAARLGQPGFGRRSVLTCCRDGTASSGTDLTAAETQVKSLAIQKAVDTPLSAGYWRPWRFDPIRAYAVPPAGYKTAVPSKTRAGLRHAEGLSASHSDRVSFMAHHRQWERRSGSQDAVFSLPITSTFLHSLDWKIVYLSGKVKVCTGTNYGRDVQQHEAGEGLQLRQNTARNVWAKNGRRCSAASVRFGCRSKSGRDEATSWEVPRTNREPERPLGHRPCSSIPARI